MACIQPHAKLWEDIKRVKNVFNVMCFNNTILESKQCPNSVVSSSFANS